MSIFTWGFGKNGQLGHGKKENSLLPVPITFVKGENVNTSFQDDRSSQKKRTSSDDGYREGKSKRISAGGLMTGLLQTNGCVYSCGSGTYGRLGTGEESDHLSAVKVDIPGIVEVLEISCGIWHGVAITSEGLVYVWGYNRSHGVLGLEPQPAEPFLGPSLITSLDQMKIRSISCGNNYTLAIDEEGHLYSWGFGKHGVLGVGDEKDRLTPTPVKENIEEKIAFVDAGFAHCGLVTENGKVWMAGKGVDGALGFGSSFLKSSMFFQKIESLPSEVRFKEISCSKGEHHGHTLALTDDGHVYSWGDGYKGKLGLGDQESRFTPSLIDPKHFNDEEVKHVSAGGIHSAAVTKDGNAFTWGCGSDGRLGHPEAKGHRYLFRSDVPRLVESLKGKGKVIDIKATYYHTVCLVE